MRRDVQEIFRNTPHSKQVMMFSATLGKDVRPVCKKFMQDVIEILLYLSLSQFTLHVLLLCWSIQYKIRLLINILRVNT